MYTHYTWYNSYMTHHIGFRHAWEGVKYAFTSQPNFKVHTIAALTALTTGLIVQLPLIEWLILLLTISLVLSAEMINTALESMTDLIEEKYHQNAKIAKDVSAGMVLLTALTSVIVGVVLFLPKFIHLKP